MPVSDPIGDLITRMRNAQHGRRTDCRAQWSKIKQSICDLMKQCGYLESVAVEGEGIHKEIVVTFRTDRPVLELKRVSTPGGRKYAGASDLRALLHGSSIAIVSTSFGLLTHKDAKAKNVGGEVLCTVS